MEKGVLINDKFQYDIEGVFLFCLQEGDCIDIYFFNNTYEPLSIDLETGLRDISHGNINFDAMPQSLYFVVVYPLDSLNDGLKFDINILREKATGSRYQDIIKIKPKNFFTKKEAITGFDKEAYVIKLFAEFPILDLEPTTYLKKDAYLDIEDANTYVSTAVKINLEGNEKEIDLHIEHICSNYDKMKSGEILNYQVNYFISALDEAVVDGLTKLTVCHGIGKGILKNKIHQILSQSYDVKSFKNEYHHKFGFGSTEIFLK